MSNVLGDVPPSEQIVFGRVSPNARLWVPCCMAQPKHPHPRCLVDFESSELCGLGVAKVNLFSFLQPDGQIELILLKRTLALSKYQLGVPTYMRIKRYFGADSRLLPQLTKSAPP